MDLKYWLFVQVCILRRPSLIRTGPTKTIRLRILESSREKQIISTRGYCHYLAPLHKIHLYHSLEMEIFFQQKSCIFASEGVTRVAWDNMQLHKKPCYQRRRWIDCLNRTTYTLIVASSAGFNSTVSSWKECEYKYGDNRDIWHHLANQIKY